MPANYSTVGRAEYNTDIGVDQPELRSGDFPLHSEPMTLAITATEIDHFTVLGRVTATNEWKVCDTAAADGSQVAAGILGAKAPISATPQNNFVILSGCFNPNALSWHPSFNTPAKRQYAFVAAKTIFLKTTLGQTF